MSAHQDEPKAIGKYDCIFDSWIHGDLVNDGFVNEEFGDVHTYGVWTGKLDLDPTSGHPDEAQAVEHYGGGYLIVQEDAMGFVAVVAYADDADREAEFRRLWTDWNDWENEGVEE